jgi:5-hydroxyisourate hydrolase
MSLSTHVLDATTGRPAESVRIAWESWVDATWTQVAVRDTDADGRVKDWGQAEPGLGVHRLVFATGAWFAARRLRTFYPEVSVVFEVSDAAAHHHVPLLLSPFAYSTYRGS